MIALVFFFYAVNALSLQVAPDLDAIQKELDKKAAGKVTHLPEIVPWAPFSIVPTKKMPKPWDPEEPPTPKPSFPPTPVPIRFDFAAPPPHGKFRRPKTAEAWAAMEDFFAPKKAIDVLKWIHREYSHWVLMTSLGPSGIVLIDLLDQLDLLRNEHVRVVMIDTLYLFNETYALRKELEQLYDFKIYVYAREPSRRAFEDRFGPELWKSDPIAYAKESKILPMVNALEEFKAKAWVTGRRKDQGGDRSKLPIVEPDLDGRFKFNPLVNWKQEEVWAYIKKNKLPYNKLHDEGYESIGDYFSTSKTIPGKGERSGRWADSEQTECGMHTLLTKIYNQEDRLSGEDWEDEWTPKATRIGITTVSNSTYLRGVVEKVRENSIVFLYSPLCMHCRQFTSTFFTFVEELRKNGLDAEKLPVYRIQFPGIAPDIPLEWEPDDMLRSVKIWSKKISLPYVLYQMPQTNTRTRFETNPAPKQRRVSKLLEWFSAVSGHAPIQPSFHAPEEPLADWST